jgi:ABC-type phosphate transport system substrate-binding protein
MNKIFLKIGMAGAVWLTGALPAAALDGVVLIANNSVTADNISAAALKDIYTGRTMYWQDGQRVGLAVLTDETGGKTDAALEEVSGMDASHFKTFWQRMVFSGRGQGPEKTADAAALVALVASTRGAIALVPADARLKGVKTLEIR